MHPLTLLAVILLVVNDWVLKARFPGVVTGKLSDVAGLVFAPVVLSAAIGLVLKLARVRDPYLTQRRLLACIVLTGVSFAVVKLSPDAADWLARTLSHVGRRATIAVDRTDLLTLPALAVAYWIGRDEIRRLGRAKP